MSSITKSDLINILEAYPDDAEIIMNIKHKYDISKESGMNGWYAYINGCSYNELMNEVYLMN